MLKRFRQGTLATGLAAGLGAAAVLIASGAEAQYPGSGPVGPNPCLGENAAMLRCPNLKMAKPRDLYVTRSKKRPGKVLLHATNNILSRGRGPLEVRGKRLGRRTMSVRQVIHTTTGKRRFYKTKARLAFYPIPGQGRYWKFHRAARFELWSIGGDGKRKQLIRKGPKLTYCFRDLKRTKASRRSPKRPVYPACSQDPSKKFRTLGTSVGWSDIYPSTYHQNWINIRGLRGCFGFVHRADPANLLYESNERDNTAGIRIRLPPKGGKIRRCKR